MSVKAWVRSLSDIPSFFPRFSGELYEKPDIARIPVEVAFPCIIRAAIVRPNREGDEGWTCEVLRGD